MGGVQPAPLTIAWGAWTAPVAFTHEFSHRGGAWGQTDWDPAISARPRHHTGCVWRKGLGPDLVLQFGSHSAQLGELEQVVTSLGFCFLTCKRRINIVLTSLDCFDDEVLGLVSGQRLGSSKCQQLIWQNVISHPLKDMGRHPVALTGGQKWGLMACLCR